jgi:23S rRNA (cytidine1920-2'-O)/16S rRNA (cytidine1409-2'-O)-methyltransferase
VSPDDPIVLAGAAPRYVSRGGDKLAGALDRFALDLEGCVALDAGASTGGFTDCLLQHGVERVYAVDVGRGQLAWSLRQDPRVVVHERTNARYLTRAEIPESVDLVVADLSFISLTLVVPALMAVAAADAEFVLLVKPQFEAGRDRVGRGGVVRDAAVHAAVLTEVSAALEHLGLHVVDACESPLLGPEGNREFFVRANRSGPALAPESIVVVATAGDGGS